MSKIGLYGGTFDPIHLGHIKVALLVIEHTDLEEIWFVPTYCAPHKLDYFSSSSEDRWAMLQLALEGYNSFKAVDIEVNRQGVSYTIDTLKELKSRYPDHEFHIIIGEDNLENFDDWKDSNIIMELASPIVIKRFHGKWRFPLKYKQSQFYAILETPLISISSTEIRSNIDDLYIEEKMDFKVLQYFKQIKMK